MTTLHKALALLEAADPADYEGMRPAELERYVSILNHHWARATRITQDAPRRTVRPGAGLVLEVKAERHRNVYAGD